jgi:hypothetical protein
MQWLIQDSGVTFDCLDRNVKPLVEAVDHRGLPRTCVGYVPFVHTLTGIEGLDRSVPTMFYGSTKLAELAMTSGFAPGGFYDAAWFDPGNWVRKRPDLLNEAQTRITAGQLRQTWISEPTFVKSVDAKVLTGMVLEGPDRGWWTEEYSHVKDTDVLTVSPVQTIDQEWRFFIVEGEVVAGSQYRKDGCLRWRAPIDDFVWFQARKMAKLWLPAPTVVMDICLTKNNWFKVVEFNCVNSSGFYSADVGAFVDAMEKAYAG